jgi:glucose-1-phosphate thymidylyltransferase
MRKGILLAGGSGTRLYPLTKATSKQLLPIYNKPLVYYPLTTLMLAGIRDILVITTEEDSKGFTRLLSDGSQWGIAISYAVQRRPDGLAQALLIGRSFIGCDSCALILGDNLFFGHALRETLTRTTRQETGATVFGYRVRDPERYGVVTFDQEGLPIDIEEKPVRPRSTVAVTGLYFYDSEAPSIAAELQPSPRGELEITDVNRAYLAMGRLKVERLGRGYAWFDAGTQDDLLEASIFVRNVEHRQGLLIACPEEVAHVMGWIDDAQLEQLALSLAKSNYGRYLREVLLERHWRVGSFENEPPYTGLANS